MQLSSDHTCLLHTLLLYLSHLTWQVGCHDHSYRGTMDSHGNVQHMQQGDKPKGFHDPKVVQDREHIKEHLDGVADMGDRELTQEELEFHYFKLHDFDNNTKLDGLEIYKALTHLLPYDAIQDTEVPQVDTTGKTAEQVKLEKLRAEQKYYTDIVDQVLREDDLDNDGYLTYLEYVLARRREEIKAKRDADRSKS